MHVISYVGKYVCDVVSRSVFSMDPNYVVFLVSASFKRSYLNICSKTVNKQYFVTKPFERRKTFEAEGREFTKT